MEDEGPARGAPGSRNVIYALIAVIVAIVVVIAVLFAAGILRTADEGLLPEAVFFIGYPGDGDKIVPEWWSNRAQWDIDWLWSEGLKTQTFIDRLKDDLGVDPVGIEGTAPVSPTGAAFEDAFDAFRDDYFAVYNEEPNVFDPHTYDAVFVISLAMVKAFIDDGEITGETIRANLRDVANPPGDVIIPNEWESALAKLEAGTDINYEGASGDINFDVFGEVRSNYEVWEVDEDGTLIQTKYITIDEIDAFAPPLRHVAPSRPMYAPPATQVKIGTILPITGALADFGGTMQQAAQLATDHINDNGGVSGTDLDLVTGDSQTVPTAGADVASGMIGQVPAIVGAAASSVSQAIFAVTAPAGVLEMSPASTSPIFTTQDTTDLFWRTAPPDSLQGKAAALYAIDKWSVMSTLFINNAYGVGLARVFEAEYIAHGGTILRSVAYQPDQATYTSTLETLFTPVQPMTAPPMAAVSRPARIGVAA